MILIDNVSMFPLTDKEFEIALTYFHLWLKAFDVLPILSGYTVTGNKSM